MKVFKITLKLLVAGALSIALLLSVSSCKKLEEKSINEDQKALPYGPYVPGGYLTSMMQSIVKGCPVWWQQVQQNLNADIYSGYMMSKTPFNSGQNNTNYYVMDGWNGFAWNTPVNSVLNPWLEVKKITENTEKDLYGISLILKVMGAHRQTDIFGPIVYTPYGEGTNASVDCQDVLYDAFFTDLKKAVDLLTTAENADPAADQARFAAYDVSSLKGDYKKWVQLANTLRLRLAIRISVVSPAKAKTEAEAAVAHPFGLLETDAFTVSPGDCGAHYLATISNGWGDISLGAPMESFLNGYSDPRGIKYALMATDNTPGIKGTIKGIRNGADTKSVDYSGYSRLNFATSDPILLMSAAESFFLRAEGVIRTWNMGAGTAQQFYEDGVSKSFSEHGISSVTAYLSDATSKPAPYMDPLNPANNVPTGDPNLSTITVKWNSGAGFNEMLERIITQKWLAGYPEGQEAWSEFRRTKYPKLFPVVNNNSGLPLPSAFPFIRRLPYTSTFKSSSPAAYQAALNCLGGADNLFTPLWWDKN